jgi:hypothetical protein
MYRPSFPPPDAGALPGWLVQETNNIAREMLEPKEFLTLKVNHKEPRTTSDVNICMLAVADGTDWDPGSGYGLYSFNNGSWTFIG